MAVNTNALPFFTPDTSAGGAAVGSSAAAALPGTPASDTTVLVTNLGNFPMFVKLGTTNAVTVTPATGLPVMPGEQLAIGIGSNTWIATICAGGAGSSTPFNLTTGN